MKTAQAIAISLSSFACCMISKGPLQKIAIGTMHSRKLKISSAKAIQYEYIFFCASATEWYSADKKTKLAYVERLVGIDLNGGYRWKRLLEFKKTYQKYRKPVQYEG